MTKLNPTEYHIDPIPSFTDVVTWPSQVKKAFSRMWTYYNSHDYEGFRDHLVLLFQKPISAINTIGNLFILIRESAPFFSSSAHYILPLTFTTGAVGTALCVSQIYLETVALARVLFFESKFINSVAPESEDHREMQQWAKKTVAIVKKLLGKEGQTTEAKYLESIQSLCEDILDPLNQEPEVLSKLKDILTLTIQLHDLSILQNHIQQTDEKSREELYRRLGVNFVHSMEKELGDQIQEISHLIKKNCQPIVRPGAVDELESLESGKLSDDAKIPERAQGISKTAAKVLKSMHIQMLKRKIAHKLGTWGAAILLAGIITSLFCPMIGLGLILLGSLIGVARFLFWIGYSESEDWNFELGQWVSLQIEKIQSKVKEWVILFAAYKFSSPFSCDLIFRLHSKQHI